MKGRTVIAPLVLLVGALLLPSTAAAHCDSMDGPVVKAALAALQSENVNLALIWVRAQDEPVIREAFARTLAVRRLGPDAQALADYWFFETLVRVHRAGEGEPYTGLKPAGYEPPPGIAAADRAIALGSVDSLSTALTARLADAVRDRFGDLMVLSRRDPGDVEAGRRWVQAYVEFIHFMEGIDGLLHGENGGLHHPGAAAG